MRRWPAQDGRRALGTALGVAILLAVAPASADPTDACFSAHENGQVVRRAGKLVQARQQFIQCSQTTCPAMNQADCVERVNDIDRVLPTLIVEVKDEAGADVARFTLQLDGVTVPADAAARPIPLDPGAHTAVLEGAGFPRVTREIVLREGDRNRRERVVLTRPGSPVPPRDRPVPPKDAAPADPAPGRNQRILAVGVGALGVVGLGAAGVFALKTRSSLDESAPFCDASKRLRPARPRSPW